ncbi:MAG: hypothetical protein AUK35_05485 [Zetaproteobacteria bacterium CG2_30_46_52]|nr:MAG: hypothetical protein AUK35_05485 [Zetaproteobacteria bacterium CG2_30_46_52]
MNAQVLENIWEEVWEENRVRAFWDRPKLSFEKWLYAMRTPSSPRHNNMATLSFQYMKPRDLVVLLGEDVFVNTWAEIRDSQDFPRKVLLDYEWGNIVTGSGRFGFNANVLKLRKTHRDLLACMVNHEPMSIYQLAKAVGRDYRRVIDGVKKLVDMHVFAVNETQIEGRKTSLVSVVNVSDLDAALMARQTA